MLLIRGEVGDFSGEWDGGFDFLDEAIKQIGENPVHPPTPWTDGINPCMGGLADVEAKLLHRLVLEFVRV